MRWRIGSLALTLSLVTVTVGCTGRADAVAPESVAPYVEAARESLTMHQDGMIRSSFWFRSAECREDGGMVLYFEQDGPIVSNGLAVAMSGEPQDDPGTWAGGYAPIDPETDSEVAYFFSESPRVDCE